MDCKDLTWILFCVIWIVCCLVPSSEAYDDNLFSDTLIVIKETNETIQSKIASFGPRIYDESIEGIIVPMSKLGNERKENGGSTEQEDNEDEDEDQLNENKDHNNKKDQELLLRYGCREVTEKEKQIMYENNPRIKKERFIALVERGGSCSFSDKVRNMQKSGAKAVIVGNNRSDFHLITMYANDDTSDINIPSVFILQYDMFVLKEDAPYKDIYIIESDTDWPAPADIFMITTMLPIIFIFAVFIIFKFRVEASEANLHNESNASLGAATQEEVEALPIKVFSMEKKKENDPETCAVCIDDFQDGDKLRVLPCRHEYHVECIDLWLTTRKSFCPICKRCINDDDADENTPLLGGSSSTNNSYSTDGQSLSSLHSNNHIIDIDSEEGNEEENNFQQNSVDPSSTTSQEEIIQPIEVEDDNSSDNEPLINLVTRS
ncbi:hypothetical protein BCR36DRAFT_407579 [Piromyces finnis]|uniref:RING-type E3 ubiquitin transferase n=1 Tax=Piromyces finnis TaxID=1754191 RepID=A0A1Y1UQQ9_9FUNG|nr:hypothetical protein BCR36DRAFT_407579 [Piromyces finnis]|eukprot:ORX40390.1 hypothetical protein BCR36DRAFT_407579 [Piromyces finnis]